MAIEQPHGAPATSVPPGRQPVVARAPPHEAADFLVVGIGASAGGLEACRKLLSALPDGHGMACILVQHLDPTHDSMMVDLLADHTPMTVLQAADGMRLAPDHVYVIAPGTYLSVSDGALHVLQPQARHGARLPFDFLLHSLAKTCGARAVCVILSGTGADGSAGLKSVKANGGLVVAQDPNDAAYGGMPRSAISTGAVDLVLPAAEIGEALVQYLHKSGADGGAPPADQPPDGLPAIIELLRTRTDHDFRLYKPGTLQRRIERRMGLGAIKTDDMRQYLDVLHGNPGELDLLAKDLLINVTSFFRDPRVFDLLAQTIVPELLRSQPPDRPLRIWIAGCSTGEETYSLAMLFREQITAAQLRVKLQLFASDVDPDAVAYAREGLYPETIEADVSPERLSRFFAKDDHGYRVLPELRAAVVFTVQDVLADPPFSRIDLISCRNLLIYLQPAAQAKVISLFHFALREGGVLLLGSSETVGDNDGRFEVIAKPERLYRHIGRSRPGELGLLFDGGDGVRSIARAGPGQPPARQAALAELCRRLVMESYAPAAVLVNRKNECLYSVGATDQYLRVVPGHPTLDLLAMAREGVRSTLAAAIQQAGRDRTRVVVAGQNPGGNAVAFNIDVRPVVNDGEQFLLICFVETPKPAQGSGPPVPPQDLPRVAELERELAATRAELQSAIRSLEISGDEQRAINEEALSVNEEYQSTNEELMTSKEELQSLNEELTALNSQLQETLERQRTTANDLQNILYSTDVATLFLDTKLNIRFFTPATKALFNVIPGDVGRPLADLASLASDGALLTDAGTVLRTGGPLEREIETASGAWYSRRILPYRTQDNGVEGVVITFADITDRRHAADALTAAKRQAEMATVAKSRFLAAASHDLRQPLQTLTLLQALLTRNVEGDKVKRLVARMGETLGAMSGMLDTLLDINQIEAGTVHPEIVSFPVNELLSRLNEEFTYHAQAKGLALRAVPCSQMVRSDPRLLEQMIRNLLSNALKYTRRGKMLLGCRRHGNMLSIEIWDTGIGIPDEERLAILEEYHQVDNPARERSRGLGLGLSIVQRLGNLLGHRISVSSRVGKGSMFAIEVMLASHGALARPEPYPPDATERSGTAMRRSGAVLVVEDDPEVRDLLELVLKDEGHRATVAPDGVAALELVARAGVRPDLVLADYNLPNGLNGLQFATTLRQRLHAELPVIILTGDISTGALRDIGLQNCVQLNKPVKVEELTQAIQRLLAAPPQALQLPSAAAGAPPPVIFVVDDDSGVREAIRELLEADGRIVEDYADCEAFLADYRPGREACLLIDAYLPGKMTGIELLNRLAKGGDVLPAIMITGNSDVPIAVAAMKAGASDFIEKPIGADELRASIERALERSRDVSKLSAWRAAAAERIAMLTAREREIMDLVLVGHPNKNIAADLGISQRTVENHRAAVMKKTGTKSLPELARLALAAASNGAEPPSRDTLPAVAERRTAVR